MYGINLLEVAKILGATTVSNVVFNKYGVIRSIHQEIIIHFMDHIPDIIMGVMPIPFLVMEVVIVIPQEDII